MNTTHPFLTDYFERYPARQQQWEQIVQKDYAFTPQVFALEENKFLSYIDTGAGHLEDKREAILCVHGNPTWSYYYRHLATTLGEKYRVIIPDHLGMGLSSRKGTEQLTLSDHVKNLVSLLEHLSLQRIHLVVHDWGGPIGLLAVRRWLETSAQERQWKSISFLNTAVTRARHISRRIRLCRGPLQPLVRYGALFNWGLPRFGVHQKLARQTEQGLFFPYHGQKQRQAVAGFIRDIPLASGDSSYAVMDELESFLPHLAERVPAQILWGERDFCFDKKYLSILHSFFPQAKVHTWPEAGHLLMEEFPQEVGKKIELFVSQHA